MEQWPLVLGIRMHVYLMQTSSLETCRRDSTHTSQNPPWLLANVPSPTPSATAAGGLRGRNAMCLLSSRLLYCSHGAANTERLHSQAPSLGPLLKAF